MTKIPPGWDAKPTVTIFDDRPLDLATLKAAIDGGYLEVVPQFDTVEVGGRMLQCVAFCDEDGIRKELPVNQAATGLWELALSRKGG